LFHNERNIQ